MIRSLLPRWFWLVMLAVPWVVGFWLPWSFTVSWYYGMAGVCMIDWLARRLAVREIRKEARLPPWPVCPHCGVKATWEAEGLLGPPYLQTERYFCQLCGWEWDGVTDGS